MMLTKPFQIILLSTFIGAYLSTLKLINNFNRSTRPIDTEIKINLTLHYSNSESSIPSELAQLSVLNENGRLHQDINDLAAAGKIRPNHTNPIENYLNHDEMSAFLLDYCRKYPEIIRLYSIGRSVQGRQLWVALVTEDVNNEQVQLLRPNVKYVANMHGNEPLGRELLMKLLAHLAESYYAPASNASNLAVKELIRSTRVHLMPSMNPDGFEISKEGDCFGVETLGRLNANGIDLNRNFPDYFERNATGTEREFVQPETEATKLWLDRYTFVLAANLHEGALVASYPNDNAPTNFAFAAESKAPDDDVIKHLASRYASQHKKMHLNNVCPSDDKPFRGGITNGFAWYQLAGGMQDYSYYFAGFIEITLELSCCKYPQREQLAGFWDDNKQALIAYLLEANKRGVRGLIKDSETGETLKKSRVELKIKSREAAPFHSSEQGEFWRILLPGNYVIEARCEGYEPLDQPFLVQESQVTTLTIHMKPLSERKFYM